jgi:hypothetical protein
VYVVRIKSVRFGFLFLSLLTAAAIHGQTDPQIERVLPEIARQASQFWHSAPSYMARENLKQKAIVPSRRRLHIGPSALDHPTPSFKDREIVSYYGFSSYRAAPEALHEFRLVTGIDGKPVEGAEAARAKLRTVLESNDDNGKRSLLDQFQKDGLGSTAIDFGQLILLFTRANLDKYSFELNTAGMMGADRTLVIAFRQIAGKDSLRISDAGKKIRRPLRGELVVRESDSMPLRVTLTSEHQDGETEIRDHATVEYTAFEAGVVLPATVAYRRYLNDQLYVENVYEYSDWEKVDAK